MHTKVMTLASLLLCASAWSAGAQEPAAGSTGTPSLGSIDVGFRGGSTDGDVARYERFRDLRNGAFTRIRFGKETDNYQVSLGADNVGYRDQEYFANYLRGKSRLAASWISTPLNYSYLTSTPWVETSTGVFTLDVAARTAVQNKAPGVVGVPQTAANLLTASIYRGLATPFDLQSRRDTASGRYSYDFTHDLGFNLYVATTKKGGNQPYGMSFSFNNANELPMPLDNRTNDVSTGLEWVNPQGMLRVAWDASWFTNKIHEVIWDNPLRATDTNPYDASGYSNGNGPARGRMSMPPSNSLNTVSTTGLYKMAPRTTINGMLSFTAMNQNDTLIPWTINNAIANPTVYASFPNLATLPRTTAEAKVHGLNGMLNFTSRPNSFFGLSMRYRFNDHRNLTPEFDATEYVRFDAVPEETGSPTEQFNIRENTFDVEGTFNVMRYTSLKLGYIYDDFNRTGRAFSDSRDYTLRSSLDVVGNQYVTVRAMFDHATRIGSGFSEASVEEGGSQPGLRFYDEADRDRNRGTLIVVVNPLSTVDLTGSVARGRDVYNGPGHEFGLLDNDNTTMTVGAGFTPNDAVSLGVNYGRDKLTTDQKSRNANPAPDPTFTDPSRDWTLKNAERVNNFDVFLDLPKAIEKTTVHIAYDYSDSDNALLFGGPRVAALAAIGQFIPLPDVTNKWHRLSADARYQFSRQVGVGIGYLFEKFDIADYGTIDLPGQPGVPRIDWLGEINTGYGNRPYKGNTVFLRLLYLF
jgi:MtrB/PioB family decaheme-associated outer membrane protein